MPNKFEVSFNSPQCGWMSIGFENGESEFHTTTACEPHTRALSEILRNLTALLEAKKDFRAAKVAWSRNPEAYNLFFSRSGPTVHFQVVEYPTFDHLQTEGELVFSHHGRVPDFCRAFHQTFAQLYADKDTDEFEFNWRQPFPYEEYAHFEDALNRYGR